MTNFWVIARHEYRKIVMRKSFLVSLIGIPLMIIVIMGVSIIANTTGTDKRPVGYVDQAGLVKVESDARWDRTFIEFEDEGGAEAALNAGEIPAYFLVPAGYPDNGQVEIVYWDEEPRSGVLSQFSSYLRRGLVSGLPVGVQTRLVEGPVVTLQSADGRREVSDNDPLAILLPFMATFLFVFVVMTSSSYLLQVVTDEKENRTVEVLLTSLSPEQLIGGKVVGLMAVAFTQLAVWLLTAVIALIAASQFIEGMGNVSIPVDLIVVTILYFIPAFALMAGLMTAVGGVVTENRQGQQIAGLLNMLFLIPLFLIMIIMTDPGGPVVLAMTLFPTTSFVAMSLRWGFDVVPLWQIILSWAILVASASGSIWASARIFRAGMLRYGQRLSVRGILAALQNKQPVS